MNITTTALAAAALACAISASAVAQERQIPVSKWGPDDEAGAANLVTPDRVKAAAGLVTGGKVYPLGIETNSMTPAYPPRGWKTYIVQPGQQAGTVPFPNGGTYNDDIVSGWLGIGTQIDGLGHVGVRNVYYNQNHAKDFAQTGGLTKLGVEKIPPLVARGVLIDMAKHKGVKILEPGAQFTMADVEAAMKAQGVTVGEGDIVLFNTGWMNVLADDPKKFGSLEPGPTADVCEGFAAKGVVAMGGDTWGLDAIPPAEGNDVFPCHAILLAQHGIYILENMDTRQLAADGVTEFMFALGVPKITGAVQMIVNPLAIR
ncbi:MAG: cyclase family protein [Pseudomonadota bacterium]|nr:cyclase family protein [Pseudomonadota bacterium]